MSFSIYPTRRAAKLFPPVNEQLSNTGVISGTYSLTDLTVNSKGLITNAEDGELPNTGVVPGTYLSTNLTVNSKGLITNAANGGGSSTTTELLLENTSPPSVPALIGGLFVSDGSGSELENSLYYRKESNGIIIPVLNPPNQILITQLSDFPTPVGGVITLDGTKLYIISGIIDIGTNTISSSGSILIQGGILTLDRIIKNDATPLFTHNNGFPLQLTNLVVQNTSGPIFSIDGLSLPTSLISLLRIGITNSTIVGVLSNTSRISVFDCSMSRCFDGLTISGNNLIISLSNFNVNNAQGTFTGITIPTLTTIESLLINDSNWDILVGQTGLNIDPSVTIVNKPARIDDIAFNGGGTYLTGITPANPDWEFFQNIGILNSITLGLSAFSSITQQIIPVSGVGTGVFIPIETSPPTAIWNTSPTIIQRISMSSNTSGELTYDGVKNNTIEINAVLSIASTSGNRDIAAAIYVDNGGGYIQCADSEFFAKINSSVSILTTNCVVKISPGAKFQVRIAQVVGTTVNMLVNTCRFEAKSLAL